MAAPETRYAIIRGDEEFRFDIVGEASYQDALELIAEGRTSEGARNPGPHMAVLWPEPNNPHDSLAVCVQIGGEIVGYLPRYETQAFRAALAAGRWDAGACHALLVGGWERSRGRDKGSFGVRLNVVLPFELIEPDQRRASSLQEPRTPRSAPWWKRLIGGG